MLSTGFRNCKVKVDMKYYIDKWEELPRDVQKEYENLADSLFISPMFVASIYESGQFGFYETEE